MSLVPVAEAAEILGVDRRQVRRLARAGLISGRQSSAGWLLDEDSVRRRAASQPPPGRPLSPKNAWALLKALDQVVPVAAVQAQLAKSVAAQMVPVANMKRHEGRRLAEHLAKLPDEQAFWNLVRRRAEVQPYRVHPGVVAELARDASVSLGGARALAALDGISEGSAPLLAYVDASDAARLITHYRAKPDPAGNVHLALIPPDVPVGFRPEPGKLTSASVTYTDALAADDARARGLAGQWLRQVRELLHVASPE